ncbi:competence protein ComK [Gracilibacillus alcaliphilus]|uniref:competence protein ComK n=1 Tax=Gracilibacillus alcaliphilus TaxID=1401441 RepID=UPI001959AD61|nr:competence protein ComK [Gracilibacillus alcaliphilus]MBM7679592.1 competence protein ComK [Gracilibacillus alcaliphilus]
MTKMQKNKPYRITANTLAILPKFDIEYASTIIEMSDQLVRKEKPIDIIKENCLHYGASYEGRRASIIYHLDFQQKTPIPISPEQEIYSFPSKSPAAEDCSWLFVHGITEIKEERGLTAVYLVNGEKLVTGISVHILREQWRRAGVCQLMLRLDSF